MNFRDYMDADNTRKVFDAYHRVFVTGEPIPAFEFDAIMKNRERRPAQTGYYPVLSGNAAYGWSGLNYLLDKEWTVGATLNFPLFSGFLTRSQVEEAGANLEVARANEEYVRQGIRFDIEQAYSNLTQAREEIVLAEVSVKQAKENRELAQGRYAAGVGNTIEAMTLSLIGGIVGIIVGTIVVAPISKLQIGPRASLP
ncbi:MAG: TolC family protein [Desulfomonilia bacterium]